MFLLSSASWQCDPHPAHKCDLLDIDQTFLYISFDVILFMQGIPGVPSPGDDSARQDNAGLRVHVSGNIFDGAEVVFAWPPWMGPVTHPHHIFVYNDPTYPYYEPHPPPYQSSRDAHGAYAPSPQAAHPMYANGMAANGTGTNTTHYYSRRLAQYGHAMSSEGRMVLVDYGLNVTVSSVVRSSFKVSISDCLTPDLFAHSWFAVSAGHLAYVDIASLSLPPSL